MLLSKRALKVIIAVAGVSLLSKLIKVLASFIPFLSAMTQKEAGSIGIIGGADGPTAIFVTAKLIAPLYWLLSNMQGYNSNPREENVPL